MNPLRGTIHLLVACGVLACGLPDRSGPDAGVPQSEQLTATDAGPRFSHGVVAETYAISQRDGARDCAVDADCTRAELACCSCTSGGHEVAVNQDAGAEIQHVLAESCRERIGCNLAYQCEEGEVHCVRGSCAFVRP